MRVAADNGWLEREGQGVWVSTTQAGARQGEETQEAGQVGGKGEGWGLGHATQY